MTAINMKLSKLLENLFKGIKSDAIPRAPRNTDETVSPEAHTENGDLPEEQEPEIIIESVSDDEIKKEKKSNKSSKKFFKSKRQDFNDDDDDDEEDLSKSSQEKRGSAGSVNVQAAGNVYNVLNCKGVRLGNDYYFGPVTMPANKPGKEKKYDEEQIEKDNFIRLLMEARIKPDHDYMDYISKNLGKNWHSVFRALGFTQGRIETAEINAASYDISEHTDPNYSCAYVTTTTGNGKRGFGLTFTCGRGTEIVVLTIRSMKKFIIGKNAADIFADFSGFWRTITNDSQMRWIGPEKGVAHLAAAAILNSLWDLWARLENKPLWRLLVDMEPEELVSTIDFRYITDVITKEEAIKLLKDKRAGKDERVKYLIQNGYPAYTTQVGWMGYSDELVQSLCAKYLKLGFKFFKVKVGVNFEDDYRRCSAVRKCIGNDNVLMIDANQAWSVNEAIEWVKKLAPLKPMWIEEPTSPDDVLGHAAISKALAPYNIGVATGEMCANRVMFKQFLQSGGMQYCQIDSARIGGINEILSVYLMAEKLKVKVCPHAGGVGLCEMVQHLQYWDFASLSGTMQDRLIEYVDQQHEHFVDPCIVQNARYLAPKLPGYSTEFLPGILDKFTYPNGSEWRQMIKDGIFPPPDEAELVNV